MDVFASTAPVNEEKGEGCRLYPLGTASTCRSGIPAKEWVSGKVYSVVTIFCPCVVPESGFNSRMSMKFIKEWGSFGHTVMFVIFEPIFMPVCFRFNTLNLVLALSPVHGFAGHF